MSSARSMVRVPTTPVPCTTTATATAIHCTAASLRFPPSTWLRALTHLAHSHVCSTPVSHRHSPTHGSLALVAVRQSQHHDAGYSAPCRNIHIRKAMAAAVCDASRWKRNHANTVDPHPSWLLSWSYPCIHTR
ncbi:unnamed protein product [Periconia digitata]|uniref:Uncharacterized protein n=1 Tax=Periconia digitata TaxID=1303443 RepID=A0A9W4UEB1_9PLEO|nr:unnamed protein product [Periconia digitata]